MCRKTTSASTIRLPPMGTTEWRRHSRWTGDSARRGADTWAEGSAVSPAAASSLTPGGEVNAADVHGIGQRLGDEVDHEFAGALDVGAGVFGRARSAVPDAKRDDGRGAAEQVEEGERGGVDRAVRAERRDQGDGARDDDARQQPVRLGLVRALQIKLHGGY